MHKHANLFTRLATATFFTAASLVSGVQSAPAQDTTPLPSVSDPDKALTVINQFQDAIPVLARAVRNAELTPAPDTREALRIATLKTQTALEEFRAVHGANFYMPPVIKDGKLGPVTAEVIIGVATQTGTEDVFLSSARQDLPAVEMRFLRNKLEELAPRAYINAVRSIAEDEIQGRYSKRFTDCLDEQPQRVYEIPFLNDEKNRLSADYNYLSGTIPASCLPDMEKLKLGLRSKLQTDYMDILIKISREEKDRLCVKRQPAGMAFNPFDNCLERRI